MRIEKGSRYMIGGSSCMCLVNALMVTPSSLSSALPNWPPALIFATIEVDGVVQLLWPSRN